MQKLYSRPELKIRSQNIQGSLNTNSTTGDFTKFAQSVVILLPPDKIAEKQRTVPSDKPLMLTESKTQRQNVGVRGQLFLYENEPQKGITR